MPFANPRGARCTGQCVEQVRDLLAGERDGELTFLRVRHLTLTMASSALLPQIGIRGLGQELLLPRTADLSARRARKQTSDAAGPGQRPRRGREPQRPTRCAGNCPLRAHFRSSQESDEDADSQNCPELPETGVDRGSDGELRRGSFATAAPDCTGRVRPIPSPVSRVHGSQWVTQCGEESTKRAKPRQPSVQVTAPAKSTASMSDNGGQLGRGARDDGDDDRPGGAGERCAQYRVVPFHLKKDQIGQQKAEERRREQERRGVDLLEN